MILLLLLLCPAKPVLCCLNNTGRSTLGAFSRRSFWSKTPFGLSETAVATYFPRASCVRGGGGSFGSEIEWLAGIAARDVRRPMCVLGRAEFRSPYHRVGKRKVGPKKEAITNGAIGPIWAKKSCNTCTLRISARKMHQNLPMK